MVRTRQKTSFKSCITSNEKYFILRNEHYQFKLGNLLKFLSSQGDSEMGIPILAMKNSHRDYPIKELKYLKGYSGEGIPRLKKVLTKPPDVLTGRQLAQSAKCTANQLLIIAMFALCGNAFFHDGQMQFATLMWRHSWAAQNLFFNILLFFSRGTYTLVLLLNFFF